MRVYEVEPFDSGVYRKTAVPEPPDDAWVIEPGIVVDKATGSPLLGYFEPDDHPDAFDAIRRWFFQVGDKVWFNVSPTGNEFRLSGIVNPFVTFGFTEPVPLRQRYSVRVTKLALDYPNVELGLEILAEWAWETFQRELPDLAAQHLEAVAEIPDHFRLGEAPWTSGIVNKTSELPYHRDSGNVPGSWSAMWVARHDCDGGFLHLPNLGLYLPCRDRSLMVFNGQAHLHGVTPIHPRTRHAFRHTYVVYAKRKIQGAGSVAEEQAKAMLKTTESAERRRLGSES